MKTKIFISLFVLTLVIFSSPVFALDSTSSPKTVRSQVREVRQEAKTTITQLREEKKAVISETKRKKIESAYSAIKKSLTERHAALLKIKDKLQARIDKNPMNKDTTAAKTELAKFTTAEAKYQVDLALLDSKFNEISTTDKISDMKNSLKDAVNLVRTDLNNIKKILTDTVTALAKAPKLEVTKTE